MFYLNKFKQDFDSSLPSNLGRPVYFDVDHYLDAVEQMISCDEVGFAIEMLNNIPGYYRDNVPERAKEIKASLAEQFWGIEDYINWESSLKHNKETLKHIICTAQAAPRGPIAAKIVENYNKAGNRPIVVEVGCADFWLPIGLKEYCNLDFDYMGFSLTPEAYKNIQAEYPQVSWINKPELIAKDGRPIIFACFEVVEHMKDPSEITFQLHKYKIDPDVVILSTPLYTFGGGMPDWKNNPLGHIRTYTPKEFFRLADANFGGRRWEHIREFSQVLVGVKANNP